MTRPCLTTLVLGLLFAACGGGGNRSSTGPSAPSPTPTPSPTSSLRGEVSDPTGDALQFANVLVSPDLVSASIEITGALALLSVRLAPGTFQAGTTHVQFDLDTDQNALTGHSFFGLGNEYFVNMGSRYDGGSATVNRDLGETYVRTGSVPVTFSPDGMDVAIPLALLGNDDGRMNFRVVVSSQVNFDKPAFTFIADFMPNTNLSPAVVR